jgi:hypothetical protein
MRRDLRRGKQRRTALMGESLSCEWPVLLNRTVVNSHPAVATDVVAPGGVRLVMKAALRAATSEDRAGRLRIVSRVVETLMLCLVTF